MKDYPILFSGRMVSAIRHRNKTQTRRVIRGLPNHYLLGAKPQSYDPANFAFFDMADPTGTYPTLYSCPYGGPGDRLVPRTTWATERRWDATRPLDLPRDVRIWSCWDGDVKPAWCGKSRPGRFWPKHLWHVLPRLVNVATRPERLHEISVADAVAEGVCMLDDDERYVAAHVAAENRSMATPAIQYRVLWNSINARRGHPWSRNDWVWVVTFKVVEAT